MYLIFNCKELFQIPDGDMKKCGFQGSTTLNCKNDNCDKEPDSEFEKYVCGHIAMTYTAIACLIILGDDLSRLNKKAIAEGIRALQQPDGR